MQLAVGHWTRRAQHGGAGVADVAEMVGTYPARGGGLATTYAGRVVHLGAALLVAQDQLTPVPTHKALVLVQLGLLIRTHAAATRPPLGFRFGLLGSLGRLRFRRLFLLQPEEPTALCAAAVAAFLLVPQRVKLVVKRELRASLDVVTGKYPDPRLPRHNPLLGVAVGVAAVVDEPRRIGLLSGVNHEPVVEREHVKVRPVPLVCLPQSLLAHLHVQDLPDVLNDKVPFLEVLQDLQAPPPRPRLYHLSLGVLAP